MNRAMNITNYRTKDLAVASFLYAFNKKLNQLKNDNGKYWFIFEDRLSCEKLVNTFWRKEAMVNAKDYADSIRTLKDMIFNRGR